MKRQNLTLILALAAFIISILNPVSIVRAIVYYDEPVWVVRDAGSVFGARHNTDAEARWRVLADGANQWGNGTELTGSMGFIVTTDGRAMLEMDSTVYQNGPVGIILNDRSGHSISLTSENGQLVVRDETQGVNHIIAAFGVAE